MPWQRAKVSGVVEMACSSLMVGQQERCPPSAAGAVWRGAVLEGILPNGGVDEEGVESMSISAR